MGALLQVLLGTVLSNGATIELYKDEAMCIPPALGAQWVSNDGQRKVPGCWSTNGTRVFVVFLDADISQFPVEAIKKAEPL